MTEETVTKLEASRPGHVYRSDPWTPELPKHEFLEMTLAAVKGRRGLVHGKMVDHGRVCALGALASKFGDCCVPRLLAEELQSINDSVPKATPETRRAKVICWLERQIKKLKATS